MLNESGAAAWIEHLQSVYDALDKFPIRRVLASASLIAATAEPDRLSANHVYVAPASDLAVDGRGSGKAQIIQREMMVVVALRDPSDRLGADGLTDLERVIQTTCHALIGWRPPDAIGSATFRRGSLLDFRQKSIWWQMAFAASRRVEGVYNAC